MPRRIKAAVLAMAILVSYAGWKGLGALLGPGTGGLRAEGRIPMDRKIKSILNIVVVIVVIIWLLKLFGVFGYLANIQV